MLHHCEECSMSFGSKNGLMQHIQKSLHSKIMSNTDEDEDKWLINLVGQKRGLQEVLLSSFSPALEEEKEQEDRNQQENLDLDILKGQMINNDDDDLSDTASSLVGRGDKDKRFFAHLSPREDIDYEITDSDSDDDDDSDNLNGGVMFLDENQPGPILCYYNYQKYLLELIYGKLVIDSVDLKDFFTRIQRTRNNIKDSQMMNVYTFVKDCNMSRKNAQRMLRMVLDQDNHTHSSHTSWKSFERAVHHNIEIYRIHTKDIPWPEHFRMKDWNHPNTSCPANIKIRLRNPLELIADQCISPFIQFLWQDHINMRVYESFNSSGNKVYRDIMSSEWAKKTQEDIQEKDPNGILLPIILYSDGVALGQHMDTSLCPVMGTLGWYSKKLFQKDISKFVIGYIEKIENVSESILINHLVIVCNMSTTKAKKNISLFKKNVFLEFWKFCIEQIQPAATNGMTMKVLGVDGTNTFYPRIAFHVGDDPAQHDVSSIKCGSMVRHPCIMCNYDLRQSEPYVFNMNNFRNLNVELVNEIQMAELIYLKDLKGIPKGVGEKDFLENLENKGYHPISNPFFNAPFGPNNSIYNSPPDLMHLYSAGLIKSVLLWTLTIIDAVSKYDGKDYNYKYDGKDYNFSQNAGIFDIRLQQFPIMPRNIPHLYMVRFKKGLMYIAENKTGKEKSLATGSGGNFRSSEYVAALFQTRFAVRYFI